MINASTHTTEGMLRNDARSNAARRKSALVFWILLAMELAVLGVVLVWFFQPTTAQTQQSLAVDASQVRDAIWARLNGHIDDRLVEVQPDVFVYESNVRGFQLNGVVYYYYVDGRQNYDPLSRGAVNADQVETILRENGPRYQFTIYRIQN